MTQEAEKEVVHCAKCERAILASVAGEFAVQDEDGSNELTEFRLLRCERCSSPILGRRFGLYIGGHMGMDWGEVEVLYPSVAPTLDATVPPAIARSYAEVEACMRGRSYTAAAIMCRRTLEGLAAHFGFTTGNLKFKLEAMRDAQHLDARLFEWADGVLRKVGNEAAHDVNSTVEKQDAKDALAFTRALIEYLFTFTKAFEAFKARRAISPAQA